MSAEAKLFASFPVKISSEFSRLGGALCSCYRNMAMMENIDEKSLLRSDYRKELVTILVDLSQEDQNKLWLTNVLLEYSEKFVRVVTFRDFIKRLAERFLAADGHKIKF